MVEPVDKKVHNIFVVRGLDSLISGIFLIIDQLNAPLQVCAASCLCLSHSVVSEKTVKTEQETQAVATNQ